MDRPVSRHGRTLADAIGEPGDASDREIERASIEARLVAQAATYWGQSSGEPADVELLRVDARSAGRLYWYRVRVGRIDRELVVKVIDPPRDDAPRFRLAGTADPSGGFRREFEALRQIDDHFIALGDERIGNVPILDRVEPSGAIVMERVHGTPMTHILQAHHRLGTRRSPARLLNVARHAGLWLREFHSVSVPPAVVHRARRDEFIDWMERYCAYLGESMGAAARFREIAHAARDAAEAALPSKLPTAVAHSDFAKRNVIVQGQDRVLVLDTIARRHAPIYEDLASFTVGVRFGRLQLQTYGLAFSPALLGAIDDAFLEGYFRPAPVPADAFRVYELLILLDRWAAVLTWGSRGPFGRPAQLVATRLLEREVRRAVARLG